MKTLTIEQELEERVKSLSHRTKIPLRVTARQGQGWRLDVSQNWEWEEVSGLTYFYSSAKVLLQVVVDMEQLLNILDSRGVKRE